MAKAKKFNIETFVEDAAEGVHVAQQQRQKEEEEQRQKEEEARLRQEEEVRLKKEEEDRLRHEEEARQKQKEEEELARATELAAQQLLAQQIANQQLAAQQLATQQMMAQQQMTNPYMPTPNNMGMMGVGEAPALMREDESQKSKRGRKKSLRTIERVNGKIVFLEKEMDANLARLSTFERFDKQDIIRTALYQWMEKHFDGMMLDNDGRREVIEYIQRTTTME